jgi:hypothetical protein
MIVSELFTFQILLHARNLLQILLFIYFELSLQLMIVFLPLEFDILPGAKGLLFLGDLA